MNGLNGITTIRRVNGNEKRKLIWLVDLSKRTIILPDSNDLDDQLKTAHILRTKDVREFIRLLKEEGFKKWKKEKINFPMGNYFDFIDKLAGKI